MKFSSVCKFIVATLLATLLSAPTFASPKSYVTDSVITSKIKGKIALDKSISVFNVGVTTNHGVVSLDGVVDSDSQAEALLQLAQETDGVKGINTDDLSVKNSRHPINDTIVTAKVKALFVQKHVFQGANVPLADIHVETTNGVVYLSGTVKSESQIKNATRLAKSVEGVKKVESRLEAQD